MSAAVAVAPRGVVVSAVDQILRPICFVVVAKIPEVSLAGPSNSGRSSQLNRPAP
jgi:GTP-binding protein EngB required for normal cell division